MWGNVTYPEQVLASMIFKSHVHWVLICNLSLTTVVLPLTGSKLWKPEFAQALSEATEAVFF